MNLREMIFGRDCGLSSVAVGVFAVERLRAIRGEISHLQGVVEGETARANSLRAALKEMEAERIKALLDARLAGTTAETPGQRQREGAVAEGSRKLADAEDVIESARKMILEQLPALESAKRAVRKALGAALDDAFAEAAAQYGDVARKAAELAVKMAALQGLMISKGSGNSNGFEARIYLPAAEPGVGRSLPPIVDSGSREFLAQVHEEKNALAKWLGARGFDL